MYEGVGGVEILPDVWVHKALEGDTEEKRQDRVDPTEILRAERVRVSKMYRFHY